MYLEKYDLTGRVAVVTGGGRGIGHATAAALGEAGAILVIAEINRETGERGTQALVERGFTAEFMEMDVTQPGRVREVAEAVAKRHGHIDVLLNNAGIVYSTDAVEISDAEWLEVIDVNLNGVYWCCREFGKYMIRQGRGSIVNLGSMSGIVSNTPQPQAHYNASKAAVHLLTKSLAGEWARYNVRVNAVAPGYVETEMTRLGMENSAWYPTWLEMTPMARVGQPSEIASAVLYLASDASSYVTGSILGIDGGYTAW